MIHVLRRIAYYAVLIAFVAGAMHCADHASWLLWGGAAMLVIAHELALHAAQRKINQARILARLVVDELDSCATPTETPEPCPTASPSFPAGSD